MSERPRINTKEIVKEFGEVTVDMARALFNAIPAKIASNRGKKIHETVNNIRRPSQTARTLKACASLPKDTGQIRISLEPNGPYKITLAGWESDDEDHITEKSLLCRANGEVYAADMVVLTESTGAFSTTMDTSSTHGLVREVWNAIRLPSVCLQLSAFSPVVSQETPQQSGYQD